jgi:3-deoxy-manno-octulosonate cytidylyltransferase (CMP-KDO synthetase)
MSEKSANDGHLRAVAIIPARWASTRFPGKPLARETGKYLVEHVWERVRAAKRVERVIVATDDERIAAACREFGAEWAMTPADCPSGTDRCARVAAGLDCDLVVNVQGDEPELDPRNVDALVALLERTDAPMATLALASGDEAAFLSPHVVKVVRDLRGNALYFSRAPIPHARDGALTLSFLWHVGIYAYRRDFLAVLAALPPSPLERTEQLEQLRVLEAGHAIAVGGAVGRAGGIDTPEQYREFVARSREARKPTSSDEGAKRDLA